MPSSGPLLTSVDADDGSLRTAVVHHLRPSRLGGTVTSPRNRLDSGEAKDPGRYRGRGAQVSGGTRRVMYRVISAQHSGASVSPRSPAPSTALTALPINWLGVALTLIRHAARLHGNATTLSGTMTS